MEEAGGQGAAQSNPRQAQEHQRQRRPLPEMILHQDGSRHAWLEGEPRWTWI